MFNEFNNHKLVIKMMQSVKFGTQTPGEKKMHAAKRVPVVRDIG